MAVCGGEEENVALPVAPVRHRQNGTATVGQSLNGLIHGQAAQHSAGKEKQQRGCHRWADLGYRVPL